MLALDTFDILPKASMVLKQTTPACKEVDLKQYKKKIYIKRVFDNCKMSVLVRGVDQC